MHNFVVDVGTLTAPVDLKHPYLFHMIFFNIKRDLSLPCVPFLHKKVGVVNCMVVGVAIKAVIESN